jgi:U4/U6 small nuclear ribonucleoprotein PRP31
VLLERIRMELNPIQSLQDQYLNDLDDLADSDGDHGSGGGGDDDEMEEDKEFDEAEAEMSATKDLAKLTRLYGSQKLEDHMASIKVSMDRSAPMPYTPEHKEDYELVCKSNDLVYELEQETVALTTYVRQSYSPRFPELEALIQNNLDYIRTVRRLGNFDGGDVTQVDLTGVLPSATIMVVTVTATTTSGKELPDDALEKVTKAAEQVLELDATRLQLLEYIESRMNILAPNLTVIVGSKVAAQMMAMAGGLQELSRMPACNVQMMGAKRKVTNGMSTAALGVRAGVINQCPMVVNSPPEFQKKAVKLIAAKCTLAARVDASNESPFGDVGHKFKDLIQSTLLHVAGTPQREHIY